MSDKYYPVHRTGRNDDVLVTMAAHAVSFEVHFYGKKVFVRFGTSCFMQLDLSQAVALRGLLDAGIADAIADQQSGRVDLVKAVA
ncbi:hypothetical protein [Nocardia sp. NPDC052566]|uniref:hypothetical protein n=1 Tax=Nocardia sp. NPDC052566 TaxID=3364330 RepID=UPI0037C5BF82